jgi:uncharacterized circularly permuted ATP-grasp superfamily protein/uncharacterized alpha-E superfamily protein
MSNALPAFDEVLCAKGQAREVYRKLRPEAWTGSSGPTAEANRSPWPKIATQSSRLMRDLGVTFSLYGDDAGRENIIPFDPFPRVIDNETWDFLCKGLTQRLRLWNEFFRDTYDSQEALKNGIVPFELVFDDPHYQRGAVGVKVPEDIFVHVAAFDLARDESGKWVVIEDYLSNTTGVTYALQSRNVLSQTAPEFVEAANLQPVRQYPTELLEHLRGFSHGSAEPRVVLLSPGPFNSAYYEHSSLARQMGIPLVRGSDLIVLNSRCFLKTIGGLEPIDVIYRRLDDSFLDPVTFRHDSTLGVPGLMTCVRKGSVTIASAIGTGLGDNRALAAYLPRLARFYSKGPLLLPTVERHLCFDHDQRLEVLSNLDRYVVRHIRDRSTQSVWDGRDGDSNQIKALIRKIEGDPANFIAEPQLPLTTLPTVDGIRLSSRHAGLRCFVFGGTHPRVFPLALTRYAPVPESRIISSGLGGGIKDTWILRGNPLVGGAGPSPIILTAPQRRLRLGSRIADSLFWMGRYKARAESTTRLLKVLQELQLESPAFQSTRSWAPLWEALARATGHDCNFFAESQLLRQQNVSNYLLLDIKNPASVFSCLTVLRENARATRESVPPEVWAAINRLWQLLDCAASGPTLNDEEGLPKIQELEQTILDSIDSISGTAAKNMLRDDSWEFWTLGRHVERALTTILVTRQLLLRRTDPLSGEPETDVNLDALLRILACQYAYRSLFQTRPNPRNVVSLILQDAALPRSVLFCLEAIRASLERVAGTEARRSRSATPLRSCAQLVGEVEFADLDSLFPAPDGKRASKSVFIDAWLEDLASRLMSLATEISDQHLYHQAFNILR